MGIVRFLNSANGPKGKCCILQDETLSLRDELSWDRKNEGNFMSNKSEYLKRLMIRPSSLGRKKESPRERDCKN